MLCIPYSASVAGKKITESVHFNIDVHVQELWSYMMNVSPMARALFSEYSHVQVKRHSAVRWFSYYEEISQLITHYASFKQVVFGDDDFAKETREN